MSPTPPDPSPRPSAHVHVGARRWVLEPGHSVSFGRGSPCDIQVAHDPVDEHVSRRAGVLEYHRQGLVVRNESATRSLIVHPARGAGRVVGPGEAVTCRPDGEFFVALSGRGGCHYVLQVSP